MGWGSASTVLDLSAALWANALIFLFLVMAPMSLMTYQGFVDPNFQSVAKRFLRQIPNTGKSGAALTVYHQGKTVMDIWAGQRDHDGNLWQSDTLALSFSTTKGVTSTLLHVLAEQGAVAYDVPVSYYWPEFAQAGKGEITVRQVLCHKSGLYDIRSMIQDATEMLDWQAMVSVLEKAAPVQQPWGSHGYHGLTYGWLVGEILHRATGQSFSELLLSHIAEPLQLDGMYVGLPEDQMYRRALLAQYPKQSKPAKEPSQKPRRKPNLQQKLQAQMMNSAFRIMGAEIEDFSAGLVPKGITRLSFNDERVVRSCIPAANGMFTARSLAKMYAMIAQGGELEGVRLLSESRIAQMSEVQSRSTDRVVPVPMHWRLGYHRVFTMGPRTPNAFGHFGMGGSGAWCDPERELSVGFTVNSSSGSSPFGDTRIMALNTDIIRCAERVTGKRQPDQSFLLDRYYDWVG